MKFKPRNPKLQAYKDHVDALKDYKVSKALFHHLGKPYEHNCEDVTRRNNNMVKVTETEVLFILIKTTIYVVGTKSGKILQKLRPPKIEDGVTIVSLTASKDGTILAGESNDVVGEKEVARTNIWECVDGGVEYSYKKTLQDHTKTVTGVAIAEPYVVTVGEDSKMMLYDYEAIKNNQVSGSQLQSDDLWRRI